MARKPKVEKSAEPSVTIIGNAAIQIKIIESPEGEVVIEASRDGGQTWQKYEAI